MFKAIKNILVFLVVFTTSSFAHTPPPAFNIDNLKTAQTIEAEINKYPDQIRFNLLYKLADFYYPEDPLKTIHFAERAIDEMNLLNTKRYSNLQMACEIIRGKAYSAQNFEFEAGKAYLNAYLLTPNEATDVSKYNALYLLSESLYKQKNYFQSLRYFKQTYIVSQNIGNSKLQTNSLLRIVSAYSNLNQTDSAKLVLETILKSKPDSTVTALCYIMYGNLYIAESDYNKASEFLNMALNYANKSNRVFIQDKCYMEFAKLSALKHEFHTAEKYLSKCTNKHLHSNEDLKSLLSSGLIYEKNENYKEANSYYKQLVNFTDSILILQQNLSNQIFSDQLSMLQREKEINKLRISKYQIEANVKKTRFLIIVSLTLILFLIISTYLIIYYQREKNKNLQIISAQKEELTLKRHKEDIRQMELKTAIAQLQGQEFERERLAKELHDGVGGTLAGIKMELESFFSTLSKKEEMNYILKIIHNTYQEVRSISKNLSLPNFVNDSLNSNITELIQTFPGKNNLQINFNAFPNENWDDIDFQSQKELYRIIQEAITNVIKHAKATELDIQIVNDQKTLTLYIEDNGIGFDMSKTWSGIGLKNLYSRASVLKGELSIESAPNEGTSLTLNFPITN